MVRTTVVENVRLNKSRRPPLDLFTSHVWPTAADIHRYDPWLCNQNELFRIAWHLVEVRPVRPHEPRKFLSAQSVFQKDPGPFGHHDRKTEHPCTDLV